MASNKLITVSYFQPLFVLVPILAQQVWWGEAAASLKTFFAAVPSPEK
jgi:hypothetical protein